MTLFEAFSLLGGIGLFLFGMTVMSSGLKNACGDNLQTILSKATKNRVLAVLVGAGMTVLVQSSSATEAMVIGFANAGMVNLVQAVGIIMGANIGTTITAQITAFNLGAFSPIILFIGAIAFLFIKKNLIKYIGEVVMGFGMLFLGITIMKEAIAPLAESPQFVNLLTGLDNPLMAIIFGIAFTALLQSSSSSTVIFQAFAIQGLLSYHTAVYLVIGAAIGAFMPNFLASFTVNRDGKRAAYLNLVFNIFRAIVLVILINVFPIILTFIQNLSPGDIGRQIANTHTIFAIIAVIIALPVSNLFIKIVEKIFPIRPNEHQKLEDRKLQYMTASIGIGRASIPAGVAIGQAQKEIRRMGDLAEKNLKEALECFFDYDEKKAQDVREREESVDILNHQISGALSKLHLLQLSQENLRRVSNLTIAITDIERLSDHAENIVEYIEYMRNRKAEMTEEARNELRQMGDDMLKAVGLSLYIFETEDYSKLSEIEELESIVDKQEDELVNNHVERLMKETCDPVAGVVFSDLVTDLERCSDHAINIAYALKDRPEEQKRMTTLSMTGYDW
jgi:phosphate:Na+ symporter